MKNIKSQIVILRRANDFFLDEVESSITSLCIIKCVLESNWVVVVGGAVEVGLSIFLDNFAWSVGTREQLATAEFSEALQVIPITLFINTLRYR